MESIRINKYIAMCGLASRREADRLIENGCVRIDGHIASQGEQVTDKMTVTVNDKTVSLQQDKVVIAFNKPVGVVVTAKDEHAEKTIYDIIDYPIRLSYAGRLDKNSEGLLLLTNDGDLIDALMKGRNGHEKEYYVRVSDNLSKTDMNHFSSGLYLKDLRVKTKPCRIDKVGDRQYKVILTEGLNRQIRRMFAEFGISVKVLRRLRIATVLLDDLPPGKYRELSHDEIDKLYGYVKLKK